MVSFSPLVSLLIPLPHFSSSTPFDHHTYIHTSTTSHSSAQWKRVHAEMNSQQQHTPPSQEHCSIENLNDPTSLTPLPSLLTTSDVSSSSLDSIPLSRLHATTTSSSKESTTPSAAGVTPEVTPTESASTPTSHHNSSIKRRGKTQDSNEPILFDDLANQDSEQLPRPSEDDDLERGVQEITVAMNEPNGSLAGLTTDEAITYGPACYCASFVLGLFREKENHRMN